MSRVGPRPSRSQWDGSRCGPARQLATRAGTVRRPPWALPARCQRQQCGREEGEPGAVPALRAPRVGGEHPTGSQPLPPALGGVLAPGGKPGLCACKSTQGWPARPVAAQDSPPAPSPFPGEWGRDRVVGGGGERGEAGALPVGSRLRGRGGGKGRRQAPTAPPSAAPRPSAGPPAASLPAGPPAASAPPGRR